MIPEFTVDGGVRVNYRVLLPPDEARRGRGAGFNEDHFDLTGTTWPEADAALSVEVSWLAAVADGVSATTEEFDDYLYDLGQKDPDTDFDTSAGLDIGVAGLGLALSAAGLLPWASYSGHGGGFSVPQVGVYASRGQAEQLGELVKDVGVRFESQDDSLWITSRSVTVIHALGTNLRRSLAP